MDLSFQTPVERIDEHIPSLTAKAEAEIDRKMIEASEDRSNEWGGVDYADIAIRECPCGKMIDGFYEYAEHLKDVLSDDGNPEGDPRQNGAW